MILLMSYYCWYVFVLVYRILLVINLLISVNPVVINIYCVANYDLKSLKLGASCC